LFIRNPALHRPGLNPGGPAHNRDYFIEQALAETERQVTRAVAAIYLDILVKRGYLTKKGERFKATKRFGDLLVEAKEEIKESETTIEPEDDPREVLAWEMARIVLQLDRSRPLVDAVNPKELGGLAMIIAGLLKSYSIGEAAFRALLEVGD
jgi:hypothetical protein